jgi:DNA helicase-2/ATP-dependent DNA helicase PcrA
MSEFPTDEQKRAIERLEGASLILAPAGSGKTAVMAARLARAIRAGFEPSRLLCVTFTNRAAAEMRERVARDLPAHASRVHVRTFHGLCAAILRSLASEIGLPHDFAIYDEEDCREILEGVLARNGGPLRSMRPSEVFFAIADRKSNAMGSELEVKRIPALFREPTGKEAEKLDAWRDVASRYHRHLAERGALDFADLVYHVRAAFERRPDLRRRFEERIDWIQVDEVQDTHFSEYDVLRRLAMKRRNLALFGDLDQTIYGWRGSDPDSILSRFRREFQPVAEFRLGLNFRATKRLLLAASKFAETFERRRTELVPHDGLPEGEAVRIVVKPDATAEAAEVARRAFAVKKAHPGERIGILGRTHKRLAAISAALTKGGVAHVTVEVFEFFRRQEVKDALARMRAILHPEDSGALRRILLRPPAGISDAAIDRLGQIGFAAGLRLADLARLETLDDGDPFAALETARTAGDLVVLDVETTGLSPASDEIVEIAATRLHRGREVASFHRLLRPVDPVGDSQDVHGYGDEHLAAHGVDPRTALREFFEFADAAHLVGHNVGFDLAMIAAGAARYDLPRPPFRSDDTLLLARRFAGAERHDLASLAAHFELATRPTHRAADDVATTVELLGVLADRAREGVAVRRDAIARHGRAFRPLANALARLRDEAVRLRPAAILERALETTGLRAFYRGDAGRNENLDRLVQFFARRDRPEVPPLVALADIVQFASLARNVDHLDADDPRIPVVTVHQAKGLEFDTVFVTGLSDGEFPSFFAIRSGDLEEERRLFYVALTRARRRLVLSGHERSENGFENGRSRFLDVL